MSLCAVDHGVYVFSEGSCSSPHTHSSSHSHRRHRLPLCNSDRQAISDTLHTNFCRVGWLRYIRSRTSTLSVVLAASAEQVLPSTPTRPRHHGSQDNLPPHHPLAEPTRSFGECTVILPHNVCSLTRVCSLPPIRGPAWSSSRASEMSSETKCTRG